jgi:predicted N-acetyltransferase YhbS
MEMRRLQRDEIPTIWTIDRAEVIHRIYQLRGGELVLTPAYFDARGWPPGLVEHDTPLLYQCFDRGGAFIGIFDTPAGPGQPSARLAGVAVIDSRGFGEWREMIQLVKLYVSRADRGAGVGARLFEAACVAARSLGAELLYVSATPTERTVRFYLARGCRLADPPDPELLAREPDDIHLVCPV